MTTEQMLLKLPISCDWVEYDGCTYFAMVNFNRSKKARKPMLDLAYCATEGLHGRFEKTVQWDKRRFKPSPLCLNWI